MKDLIKIIPKNIKQDKNNIFFTLGLIRNDFGDLVYLQSLHAEGVKHKNISKGVSADGGQLAGRNLYIFRMALSHFYNALEFLRDKEDKLSNNIELQKILSRLDISDRELWEFFLKISVCKESKDVDDLEGVDREVEDILRLSISTRHKFTYHYKNSSRYINEGFKIAFKNPRNETVKFAYATDMIDVIKDRSYYIDISIQKYQENDIGLKGNLIDLRLDHFITLMSKFNRITTYILKEYHESLGK